MRTGKFEQDSVSVLALGSAGRSVRVYYAQENWVEAVMTGENGLPVLPFDITVKTEL